MKFPVGPETRKQAAKTVPGQLAILLNHVLYSADNANVSAGGIDRRAWVAEEVVFKNTDAIPKGMASIPNRDKYFKTEELMRSIRDYLEFRSFEEVIP